MTGFVPDGFVPDSSVFLSLQFFQPLGLTFTSPPLGISKKLQCLPFLSWFLSWGANTQLNQWSKQMESPFLLFACDFLSFSLSWVANTCDFLYFSLSWVANTRPIATFFLSFFLGWRTPATFFISPFHGWRTPDSLGSSSRKNWRLKNIGDSGVKSIILQTYYIRGISQRRGRQCSRDIVYMKN